MKKIFKWYLPFLIAIIIVIVNYIYISSNNSSQTILKSKYTPVNDFSTIKMWDSIKIMHDSSKYINISDDNTYKVFLRSTIREISFIIIREDSLIMLTLCDDSLYTKGKNKIFKCFYFGPFDSEIFTIGNLVEIFGYKKTSPNSNVDFVKVDFIQKYSWFNELSRFGLTGIQILIFISILCIFLFSYTIFKLLKNEK